METNAPFGGGVLRASVSVVIATIEQCLKILRRHGAVVEETLSVAGAMWRSMFACSSVSTPSITMGRWSDCAISSIDDTICALRP